MKFEKVLGEAVEIGKVIGREYLALDNGEVNLDLIEPTGVNRGMHKGESAIAVA